MTWNYRIVRYKNDGGFGLHEVYYDDEGQPWGMTKNPASFVCDTSEGIAGITNALLTARVDAKKRPILDQPKKWPGKNPSDRAKNFRL
jgi:hypothetical protein